MGNVIGDLLRHDSVAHIAALVASSSQGSQQELRQLVVNHPKLLLSKQFEPEDNTIWHILASTSGGVDNLKWLVTQLKQLLQQQQRPEAVPAGSAAEDPSAAAVKRVLDLANVDGVTPLMSACAKGNAEAAGYLVLQGADPFRKDLGGRTALHHAARAGHAACIRAVMDTTPADQIVQTRLRVIPDSQAHNNNYSWFPDYVGDSNRTVLHCLQTVRLQDSLDRSGFSPLHVAIGYNHPECVEALLKYDVSLIPRTKVFTTEMGFPLPAGSTALHVAADRGLFNFAKAIARHQTSRMAADPDQQQPVQVSALDPRWLPNSQGATPFQVAVNRRRSQELQHLLHPSTDLISFFGIRELATPASGVPKLCYLAAASLQAKLLFDLKLVAFATEQHAAKEQQDEHHTLDGPLDAEGHEHIERAPSSIDELCAVCMERAPNAEVCGCTHRLCCECAEQLCRRCSARPMKCPFCRRSIEAFQPRHSTQHAGSH